MLSGKSALLAALLGTFPILGACSDDNVGRGDRLAREKRWTEALEAYEKAIERYPYNYEAAGASPRSTASRRTTRTSAWRGPTSCSTRIQVGKTIGAPPRRGGAIAQRSCVKKVTSAGRKRPRRKRRSWSARRNPLS